MVQYLCWAEIGQRWASIFCLDGANVFWGSILTLTAADLDKRTGKTEAGRGIKLLSKMEVCDWAGSLRHWFVCVRVRVRV